MRTTRGAAAVCAALLALGILGCGGDSGTSSTPTSTATPAPTTTVISTGTFVGLGANRFQTFDFASPASGTVVASLAWTFAANDVDLYVVSGNTCNTTNTIGTPTGAGCTILCQDIRVGGTTATCNLNATSGNARLFIVNLGPGGESGTYQVTVTR